MKKIIALVLALVMLASMASVSFASEEKPDIAGSTITAMVLQSQYIQQLQDMVFKFEEEYDVFFDVTVVPDEQFIPKLEMLVANGEMPDVVQYNSPMIYNVLDAEEVLYDFSDEPWVAKLVAPEVTQLDGKSYCFPLKATTGYHAIIYNKALFKELGLTVPTTPDEFNKVCEAIKTAGKTPIFLTSDMWVPQIFTSSGFARAFGTEAAAAEATDKILSGEVKFSEVPELVAVLDDVLRLRDAGYFNEDLATLKWDDAWGQLVAGEGAMIYGEGPMVGQFQVVYPDAEFGVFNYPAPYDPEVQYLSGAIFTSSFVTGKNCKNIEAVKAMYNAFSTPEYLEIYFGGSNAGFPAFKGVSGGEMHPEVAALFAEYTGDKMVNEMNLHWAIMEPLFSDYLWRYYAEALNDKDMTSVELLDKFQEDFDKFMDNL